MKNLFKNCKCSIAVILMFCNLIFASVTCAYATVAEEITIVAEEPVQEFEPMMAAHCRAQLYIEHCA